MPNYPWNWNEWQWPLGVGGRHAVEIIRNRTEMPFTVALVDTHKEDTDRTTVTINYLKEEIPPDITVLWGPSVSYMMKLVNSPWNELMTELMMTEIEPGQWKCLIGSEDNNNSTPSSSSSASAAENYFILQRTEWISINDNSEEELEFAKLHSEDATLSDLYHCNQLELKPPMDFDWNLLKNQFRYPAALFVTNYRSDSFLPSAPPENKTFGINGIIQIIHVKNEVFPKTSSTLAQYIKMNNGQSHILQSLFVMDEHRAEEEDPEEDLDLNRTDSQEPFSDILCSVCQVSPVTRVIIPCRHLCLCTRCFEKVEICPICRGAIMYYFKTRQEPQNHTNTNASQFTTNSSHPTSDEDESQNLTIWQRIERFNDRFSYATGLIRQH